MLGCVPILELRRTGDEGASSIYVPDPFFQQQSHGHCKFQRAELASIAKDQ